MALTLPDLIFEISYGTDAWAAPAWVDETDYLRSFKCKSGKQHELNQVDAATSELVLLNNNRRFDPTWLAGPHGGELLPGVRCRIRAVWDGVTYPILHQWAERWFPRWPRPAFSNTELTEVDAFKRLRKKALNTPGYFDAVMADAPYVYYRMNESDGVVAVDSSGAANDGLYEPGVYGASNIGAATVESALLTDADKAMDTGAIYDSALAVWRSQRYLQAPSAAKLSGAGALSVEVLFRTIQNSGVDQLIYAQQDAGAVFEVVISEVGGQLHSFGPEHNFTMAGSINDGNWHHAMLTRAANGKTWRLYCDGTQVATSTDAVAHTLVGPYSGFGGTFQSGGSFIGALDEGAVYHTELSAARVLEHFQRSKYYWPSELAGDRINRVLDNVGWPAGDRDIDAGTSTLQPVEGSLTGIASLDHMQLVEKSEAGLLYQGPDGKIVFRSRFSLLQAPYNVSQATFGDGPGELPYQPAPEAWLGDDDIYSEALGKRVGGEPQRAFDQASNDQFGPSSYSFPDLLLVDDAEVSDRLQWLVSHYRLPAPRIGKLRVRPLNDPANIYPVILGLYQGARVTVNRRPPGGGAVFSQAGIIESISHEKTEEGDWIFEAEIGAADYADYWILGVSQLGVNTRLAF